MFRPLTLALLAASALTGCRSPQGALAPRADTELRQADLAAAQALFNENLAAITRRDREGYLSCYWQDERLVRLGPDGPQTGWQGLADSLTGDWPTELLSDEVTLHWLEPGLVWGHYRYRATWADARVQQGVSERLFRRTPAGWRIVVTTAWPQPAPEPDAPRDD